MLLGKLRPNQPIHIVGAGISGLLLGHYLKKKNIAFTIHEKANRTGGLIESKKVAYGLIETAANGIVSSAEVLELLNDLKLKPLTPKKHLKRYIHRQNSLKTFPFKISELFKLFPKLLIKTPVEANQTLNQFLSPLFGTKFCKEVVSPGVRGIYAIDGDELDYQAILPAADGTSYLKYFKKFIKNKKNNKIQTLSFENGMQDLINNLSHELKNYIKLNSDFKYDINENTIFCTDAKSASTLITSAHPGLAGILSKIPYKSISSNTVFTNVAIKQLQGSFGLLSSTLYSYGILANDQIFSNRAKDGFHSYTLIKAISANNRSEIISDLAHFGIQETDIKEILTTNWENGIPCYNLKRKELINELDNQLKSVNGLLFFGNYVAGLSLRDLIKNAKQFSLELV